MQIPAPEQRPAGKISTRLRNSRNLGDLGPLADDIHDRGLRHPLTITVDGKLIIGTRRFAACVMAGLGEIPCRAVSQIPEALAVIAWENADDVETGDAKYHLPATIRALAWQDAAIRALGWWPRAPSGSGTLRPSDRGHRLALEAALLGPGETRLVNSGQYNQLRMLACGASGWQSGPGGRLRISEESARAAEEALTELDNRHAHLVNGIYTRWRDIAPRPGRRAGTLTPGGVTSLAANVCGFANAITSTSAPGPDVTAEQAEQLDAAVSDLIKKLVKYRRRLRDGRRNEERTPD